MTFGSLSLTAALAAALLGCTPQAKTPVRATDAVVADAAAPTSDGALPGLDGRTLDASPQDARRDAALPSTDAAAAPEAAVPTRDAARAGDAVSTDAGPTLDAVAPAPDAAPPPPIANNAAYQAWLFGAEDVISIAIELDDTALAALRADPHTDYVAANIVVGDQRLNNVGLKLKGGRGSFRELGQKAAFKIDLNHFVPHQNLGGLKKLTLNNMIQDTTQMHERLGSLAFQLQGLPAGRVGYAEISVNGANYGLYANVETLDDTFVDRALDGDAGGSLYEGFDDLDLWIRDLEAFDQDGGPDEDRLDLRALILALDAATPADFEQVVGARLDLDEARRFFATEMLAGHWDGYAQLRNNYYLYRRPSDGRFIFLPSGMDQAWERTNNALAGPGRVFRMAADWLPSRLAYAQAVRDAAALMMTYDWVTEIDRLTVLLDAPFSRDHKTPTRPAQRQTDIAGLRTFVLEQPDRIVNSLVCLDPARDADGDGTLSCGGDCNDHDPTIYPEANDSCGDEIDQDCSGFTDDGQDCPLCRETHVPETDATFLLCHRPVRFYVAYLTCQTLGGAFASIHTEAEQRAVTAAAAARRATRWWIGLTDGYSEGTFTWRDDSPLDYTNWADGQPDDNGGYEDCAALDAGNGGTWADYYSGYYLPFICRQ